MALLHAANDFLCSVDLDTAFAETDAQAARWDYVLGTATECIGMEVHPAKSSEVVLMLAKKRWAEGVLAGGPRVSRWCWIVPVRSRIQFTPISPQARLLAKGGVEFPKRSLR